MTWAEQELGGAPLGDARLSKRLVKLATRLAQNPSASIPQACRGWAEMRAAYRFLGQAKLDWQDILQPHWRRARNACASTRWCCACRTRRSWT
jgi:hypothetical protein